MYMNNYLPTTENEFAGNYIVDIIGKDTNYTRKFICRDRLSYEAVVYIVK